MPISFKKLLRRFTLNHEMSYHRYMEKRRKNTRLSSFDYSSPGLYFVTFCTYERKPTLGRVVDDVDDMFAEAQVELTALGDIVRNTTLKMRASFPNMDLKEYTIMPNHVHALIEIADEADVPHGKTLGDFVNVWKGQATRHAHESG